MSDKTWGQRLCEVVQGTNAIETQMKRLITEYFDIPEDRYGFFESHFLNNSIVPFGAKVKMVLAINKRADLLSDLDRNAFHVVLSRRNAFAHQDIYQSVRYISGEESAESRGIRVVVESMKGDGEMEIVTTAEANEEFATACTKLNGQLNLMIGRLVARKAAPQILGSSYERK